MGLLTFFALDGTIQQKIFKILCLICWGVGGCVYIYGMYDALSTTFMFPNGSKLILAIWLMHVGLRFFALWVPMGFLLIQWQMKRIIIAAVYITGCLMVILCGVVSVVLIIPYATTGNLRKEFIDGIQTEMKVGFPPTVKRLLDSHQCCSWFGPPDFAPGMLFDIKSKINEDLEFMKDVAKCYGDTFAVTKSGEKVGYAPSQAVKTKIPTGCAQALESAANGTCDFLIFTFCVAGLLTLVVIGMYIISYIKLPSSQVSFKFSESEDKQKVNEQDLTLTPSADEMDPNPIQITETSSVAST